MSLKITENITYVGQIDWSTRRFHGEQLTTNHGTTFNSYLLKCHKTALIDTVYGPFANEFIDRLEQNGGIANIDYMIVLHAEPDHCQALGQLMKHRPELPIYCTPNGIKSIKGYFHEDWNFIPVKTGDKLDLGSGTLTFVEVPMLHWPDQMIAYFDKDKTLFSSDIFGAHYCHQSMFSQKANKAELMEEAIKYYANIVAPYSSIAKNKLNDLKKLGLDIDFIAPSHGVIWQASDIDCITNKYSEWADNYKEDIITIAFDTMYESTRKMANAIAEGIAIADTNTKVQLFYAPTADTSDIITSVFRSKAFVVGSPTYNSGILCSVAGLLDELQGMSRTTASAAKKAAAFGSFGWATGNIKILCELLKKCGFSIEEPQTISVNWNPDATQLEQCRKFGTEFAKWCKL